MSVSPFAGMVDAIFTGQLAIDATYYAGAEAPAAVRLVRKSPDQLLNVGGHSIVTGTDLFEVRASDVARPQPDDRIVVGDDIFVVKGQPVRDSEQLVWSLDCRRAES